jgi:hypothetical protein
VNLYQNKAVHLSRWLLAAGLTAALVQPAGAQRGPGVRWPSGAVIRVWVDPHEALAGADELVARAMATWTRASGGAFTLVKADDRNAAAVRVHFVDGDTTYGEAAPRVDRATGRIASAEVQISGNIGGDVLTQRIVIYMTALHELGHALGLPHTDDFRDIMYSFRRPDDGERFFLGYRRRLRNPDDIGSATATGLSEQDLRALRELYATQ